MGIPAILQQLDGNRAAASPLMNPSDRERIKRIISGLKLVRNPEQELMKYAEQMPIAKLAIDLLQKSNGDCDEAINQIIKENGLSPDAVRNELKELGVI